MTTLKRSIGAAALVVVATLSAGCENFLDINTNPNAPETASANLYLPPMIHELVTAPQIDGRFVGRYTQQWTSVGTSLGTWDRMGYDPGSDNGGWMWRAAYFSMGQSLVDMMTKAEAEERWDLLGVGYVLKAWGWQVNTDHTGEIIVKEAINQNTFTFNYDTQEYAYQEVKRLLDKAIEYLSRTDGAVDASYMARGDKIYNGVRTKWLKFAHGLLAIHLNHYSNKAAYKPDDVIAAVDKSFTGNADDALLPYPATATDDANYWSPLRNSSSLFANYRQTQFVVNLMNGSQFGGAVDPRMSRMLSPAPDGEYRGLDINVASYGALTVTQRPNNFWGYTAAPTVGQPTRYIFDSKSRVPAMTYAQLQFLKAEAAYKKGDLGTARAAYLAGVGAHLDFVNARNMDAGGAPAQISAAEKAAFLAHPAIAPAQLTLSHIMSQKYVAQWGWGHNELWMDMRRYHYTDIDPVSGTQVFRGFTPPTTLYPDNGGKIVQRIRARYNSEYVWNRPGLDAIGGLALDFHTKPLWITER